MTKTKELLLEISYDCNLRCIHCSSTGCTGKIKSTYIPKLINLDEIGTVRLSGGEPTLNKDLDEYIQLFHKNGSKVILQTNGTISISDHMENYISNYVDEIWFSLYGSEDIHNMIIGYDRYWETRSAIYKWCVDKHKKVVVQSLVFNYLQLKSLLDEVDNISSKKIGIRLFALLNHGRCGFALSREKQMDICNSLCEDRKNIEITCSLDPSECDYENKLVLKPDGSLFNCASHKHNKVLCKK